MKVAFTVVLCCFNRVDQVGKSVMGMVFGLEKCDLKFGIPAVNCRRILAIIGSRSNNFA